MEIRVTLTQDHWKKFSNYISKSKRKEAKGVLTGFWSNFFLWLVLALVFMTAFKFKSYFHLPTGIFTAVVLILIQMQQVWNAIKLKSSFLPSEKGVFVGEHFFVFDKNGIGSSGLGYKCFHEWKIIKDVRQEEGMFMFFLDTVNALIIPSDQLDEDIALMENVHQLRG